MDAPDTGFIRNRKFFDAVHLLRQRLESEVCRTDIEGTITGTIKQGGFPVFCCRPVTRPPEYLFLINLPASQDHYAHFVASIVRVLENEGIFADWYFYKNDPQVCFQDLSGKRVLLADIQPKYRNCRLILAGTCDDLLDPVSGEPDPWTVLFEKWPERAVFTPILPGEWGMREVRLGKSFILVPATLKGLKAMAGHFDDGSVPNPAEWTRADVQPRVPPGTGDVKVLKRYMGDEEAFQWLCACAVYPELHWNLTLHLGTLCMTSGYVGEDRLLRLIRLPWFREGAMPDDIRLSLIRELKRDRLQMIRETIVEALEKKPPPEESFAYDTYQLNLAVHRKMIPGKRRRKLKEIRQAKENLGQRQVVQDYTLLRVLDSATVSPLSFLLPKRLHRLFFRDGIPLFGIKSGIWGALSVLVAAAVFFVFPKPQAPVNIKEQKPFIMKFAHIPAGEFMMGSPEDEPGRGSDENQHKVTLRDFYLQTTEVTQGQWKAIMGENPSYFKNCGNECPVETVSWEDVQKFIERLNQIKGAGTYRLPTEAEWEYACRAGTTTALYSGSIEILGNRNAPALDPIAWYGGNSGVKYKGGWDSSGWSEKQYENDRSGTHPVGKKNPNAWGLYDMLGNVWEWCQDWYGEEYPSGSVIDPEGQSTGSYRVLRGGSWNYAARNVRCANRGWYSPDDRGGDAGFRVVYSPPQ